MASTQKPVELILARNLISCLSTPAFLVDEDATLVFYNDAAAELLGKRFEETGRMAAGEWGPEFGPRDSEGTPIPIEDLPITVALRQGRPAHHRFCIQPADGDQQEIEASATPLVSAGGQQGAMVIFWPTHNADAAEGSP